MNEINMKPKKVFVSRAVMAVGVLTCAWVVTPSRADPEKTDVTTLDTAFRNPPSQARPWVYWMIMDGNLSREGITADLEAMQRAGIGGTIILEVNVGIPRGKVEFMSAPWRELVKHAINEADRIGLEIALPSGPGWCGSGGPWVKPEQSMQHLVASETNVIGPIHFEAVLPQPPPRTPYFGVKTLTPELHKIWKNFYRDVVVLAFPTPSGEYRIPNVDEKALYHRDPYTSKSGVKPCLSADQTTLPAEQCIAREKVIELKMQDGRLVWDVPPGNWTIMRFGRTITGQTTRPAPVPGLGLETDKFDRAGLDEHFASFVGIFADQPKRLGRGLTTVHFDSWEMSAQNWSEKFRDEFRTRRGYDLLRFLPAMLGRVVDSVAVSERFLWDLRRTAQELVIENHAGGLKELGRQHGLTFSMEPYDLNPAGDLALGAAADVPMGEFWSKGYGFSSEFSVFEAVSVGHTMGRSVIGAEAFTSHKDGWRQYPGVMKQQGDWALCAGINRFVICRYQHQPWLDRFPGMTFASYGVHWDRTQTWWDMAPGYHTYISRCQTLLRRGLPVADILYLDAEGAPNVFRPPASATLSGFPDKCGYNFDGGAPGALMERATVKNGRIVFPDGMSYQLLVLPRHDTMTLALLRKIQQLVDAGATIVGTPPKQSPSLENYPGCDAEVQRLAAEIWRSDRVILDTPEPQPVNAKAKAKPFPDSYPSYATTSQILAKLNVLPDFESNADLRYIHRQEKDTEIYFVGNRTASPVAAECRFRVTGHQPELWDPITGEQRALPEFREEAGRTLVPLRFEPSQSYFIVFRQGQRASGKNFPGLKPLAGLTGPWEVSFDPKRGGPDKPVTFAELTDWSQNSEAGTKFYSGVATYRKAITLQPSSPGQRLYLDLGKIAVMARVTLNGRDCGIVWTPPYRVEITSAVQQGTNTLEISVANLWPNRLIGDAALPMEKRVTFTTWSPYKNDSPLLESGLLGPVTIMIIEGPKP